MNNRIDTHRAISKKTGKPIPDKLIEPELPIGTRYLFDLYADVKTGNEKITYQTIDGYQSATGLNLTAFEISCIIMIGTELNG